METPLRFTLVRDLPGIERTFGHWMLDDPWSWVFDTLEPGIEDVGAPRILPGFYTMVPHGWGPDPSTKYRETWALEGPGIARQPLGGSEIQSALRGCPRSAVLVHALNLDEQTRACIGPGLERGVLNGEPAILKSAQALDKLRKIIGGPHIAYLRILEG